MSRAEFASRPCVFLSPRRGSSICTILLCFSCCLTVDSTALEHKLKRAPRRKRERKKKNLDEKEMRKRPENGFALFKYWRYVFVFNVDKFSILGDNPDVFCCCWTGEMERRDSSEGKLNCFEMLLIWLFAEALFSFPRKIPFSELKHSLTHISQSALCFVIRIDRVVKTEKKTRKKKADIDLKFLLCFPLTENFLGFLATLLGERNRAQTGETCFPRHFHQRACFSRSFPPSSLLLHFHFFPLQPSSSQNKMFVLMFASVRVSSTWLGCLESSLPQLTSRRHWKRGDDEAAMGWKKTRRQSEELTHPNFSSLSFLRSSFHAINGGEQFFIIIFNP